MIGWAILVASGYGLLALGLTVMHRRAAEDDLIEYLDDLRKEKP